ncbi:MAG: hypothetical protein AAF600_06865 [Bacteroidota bacterium]
MSNRFFTHTIIALGLLLFIVSLPASGSDFQTVYDSAKKMRSIEIGERALEMAEINGDEQQLAKTHFLIAFYQNEKGMYYDALNHYFFALYAYRDARNYGRQIATLKNIGIIYSIGGFYEKAISFYTDAADLAKELNDISRLRSIQYHMARSYRLSGNYEKANDIYLSLIAEKEDIKNKTLLLDSYLELGHIAGMSLNDYEQAKKYFKDALSVYSPGEDGFESAQIKSMNGVGYFQMLQGKLEIAKDLFYKAMALSKDLELNEPVLVNVYGNLGNIYEKSGLMDSSILMYEKGLELEPLKNFDQKYIQTANLLHNHYKTKSPEKREHYYQMVYEYGAELSELKAQLIKASQEYQIRAADYRRELDLRIAKEKRMFWWDIFFYALTLIVIASGVTFYYLEKRKRRKRLRKALDNARIIVPLSSKY